MTNPSLTDATATSTPTDLCEERAEQIERTREALRAAWLHVLAQDWPDEAEHAYRVFRAERAALAYCRAIGAV